MYSVLNTLLEYTYCYMSKNITSYTFWLVFKIVESLQCILKPNNAHNLLLDEIPIVNFKNNTSLKDNLVSSVFLMLEKEGGYCKRHENLCQVCN